MDFFKSLTLGTRRARIRDVSGLLAAIGEGAAFLSQGSSYSYIRARTGTMGPRFMQDAGFGASMERCKWEGFAAAAGDLILIVEAELRPFDGAGAAFWRALYRRVLEGQDMPPHRRDEGWSDRIEEFEVRLAEHLSGPAAGIEAICHHSAEVILENAPVTEMIRALDHEMVTNNVKFRFIEHVDGLRRRADWPALAADIRMAAAAQHS